MNKKVLILGVKALTFVLKVSALFYIGLPVYAYIFLMIFYCVKRELQGGYGKIWRERVNRYTNYFCIILTIKITYGIMIMGYKTRLGEYKEKLSPERSECSEVLHLCNQSHLRIDTPL